MVFFFTDTRPPHAINLFMFLLLKQNICMLNKNKSVGVNMHKNMLNKNKSVGVNMHKNMLNKNILIMVI